MRGWRFGLAAVVIAALAAVAWAALQPNTPPATTTTTTTATTTTATTSTTTTLPDTTTTVDPQARLREVEAILTDLYYRWFDAIYRNDEEAVREAVATINNLEDFRRAMSTMEFLKEPTAEGVVVTQVEILLDEPTCLVVFSTLDVQAFRGEGAITSGVDVLLPVKGSWKLGTTWERKTDLWQQDCLIEPDID